MYRKHWFQKLLLHTQKIDLFYLYINIKQIHVDCLLYSYALPSTKDKMINVIISRSEKCLLVRKRQHTVLLIGGCPTKVRGR